MILDVSGESVCASCNSDLFVLTSVEVNRPLVKSSETRVWNRLSAKIGLEGVTAGVVASMEVGLEASGLFREKRRDLIGMESDDVVNAQLPN